MNIKTKITAIITISITIQFSSFADIALFSIHPNCVDYLFKGKTSSSNGKPILSFNTLEDITIFKTIGEQLGDYTILTYSQKFDKVFVESTASYRDIDISTVTLLTPENKAIELTVDLPKETPGLLASFINTESGYVIYAKEEDNINLNNTIYSVKQITTNSAIVSNNGKETIYMQMTDETKEEIFASIQKKIDEEAQLTIYKQEEERAIASQETNIKTTTAVVKAYSAPRHYAPIKKTTKYVMGTEYAYPTRYAVFPVTKRNAQGHLYFTPVIVPTEFRRGYSGFQTINNDTGRSQLNVIRH